MLILLLLVLAALLCVMAYVRREHASIIEKGSYLGLAAVLVMVSLTGNPNRFLESKEARQFDNCSNDITNTVQTCFEPPNEQTADGRANWWLNFKSPPSYFQMANGRSPVTLRYQKVDREREHCLHDGFVKFGYLMCVSHGELLIEGTEEAMKFMQPMMDCDHMMNIAGGGTKLCWFANGRITGVDQYLDGPNVHERIPGKNARGELVVGPGKKGFCFTARLHPAEAGYMEYQHLSGLWQSYDALSIPDPNVPVEWALGFRFVITSDLPATIEEVLYEFRDGRVYGKTNYRTICLRKP